MARLTINSKNVGKTTVTFYGTLTKGDNDTEVTSITSSTGTCNADLAWGDFSWTVSDLLAGQATDIKFTLTYKTITTTTTNQKVYFFFYQPKGGTVTELSSTSRIEAAEECAIYVNDSNYSVWPQKLVDEGKEITEDYTTSTVDGKKIYLYQRYDDISTSTSETKTITSSIYTIYTRPATFYFNGSSQCTPGQQWDVSQGITSLLTNFYKFNNYATAWKRWKNQNSVTQCTAFGTSGPLTASMMNNAYSYLGVTRNYKKGNKVTASMFSGLENILND